jgi:hypothetical protein
MGKPMVKLFNHSLLSIAFVVIRIFVMDAAASPAHGKHVARAQYVVPNDSACSAKAPRTVLMDCAAPCQIGNAQRMIRPSAGLEGEIQ